MFSKLLNIVAGAMFAAGGLVFLCSAIGERTTQGAVFWTLADIGVGVLLIILGADWAGLIPRIKRGGARVCALDFHRWEAWRVQQHYWDVSWGDRVPATTMIRKCEVCGRVKLKDIYGAWVPKEGQ